MNQFSLHNIDQIRMKSLIFTQLFNPVNLINQPQTKRKWSQSIFNDSIRALIAPLDYSDK